MDKEFYNKHKAELDYLEDLRQSGVTNMYGAGDYLVKEFRISNGKASEILLFWMKNYSDIIEESNKQKGE